MEQQVAPADRVCEHGQGTIDSEEVEIEFLTDQRGPRGDVVIEVQKGLHAEALRFISILISHAI